MTMVFFGDVATSIAGIGIVRFIFLLFQFIVLLFQFIFPLVLITTMSIPALLRIDERIRI
jgi:hypothetical protein